MNKEIVDDKTMKRTLTRITYEIIEKNKGNQNLVLIGIKTRGAYLAKRIKSRLYQLEDIDVPQFDLDVTNFRDDHPVEKQAEKPQFKAVDVNGKHIVLVDDVLYTGRTIRAALDAIMSIGRPSKISLAVLVDRGHRELPIRADYVGKNIPTSHKETIKVSMAEIDDEDKIEILAN
ncbi:MAG: bifunctional pyr operon transcriptional regulator/uracil phosphoribosyltransferase PyrR [Lactobacillus sp.]|uniref:Bifunctional protein PyrR n=1 Tax=Bombilactobacillus bombi TaxID=1303590 RepID=A0A3R6W5Z7_9LACO|nr:bifunctional pyr operon transcriptional regulator/uracil phosphoribosyltransferase PyrR [Bombilactobacillus bombi]MCO6541289.1 bifunctional pyr operon transcriptional regulator/uracil phosphoribosyltransferase PyrR [Lactobacillus sp.]RHW45962.1 bifunctional pyr operon transcriptional regulator/uracil phosphoribosyltransferase PyrR [Bombilactobacillus bombi]